MATEDTAKSTALNPSDISKRQFKKSMFGGFKKEMVQKYLNDVSGRVKGLLEERDSLEGEVAAQSSELASLRQRVDEQQDQIAKQKRRIEQHEKKLAEFRQAEQSLRSALVSSQKFAEDLLETSRREADSIVESARLEKARVRLEAKELSISLTKEVRALQEQRQRLYAEVSAILDTHRNLLDKYTTIQAVDIALPEPEDEHKSLDFSDDGDDVSEGLDGEPVSVEDEYDDEDDEDWTSTPEVISEGEPLSGFGGETGNEEEQAGGFGAGPLPDLDEETPTS